MTSPPSPDPPAGSFITASHGVNFAAFFRSPLPVTRETNQGSNIVNVMTPLNRRNLLGTGSAILAFAAFGNKFALAAGSPGLTTHMLDTANGKPAEGVKIDFSVLEGSAYKLIKTVHTNADGRNAEPLLTPETMKVGQYELVFYIGEYFTKLGTVLPNPPFIEKAVIQFGMADATSHYHVPILASPWSYTTYRGS
jgi:5-hydroxyisourate hydrolase